MRPTRFAVAVRVVVSLALLAAGCRKHPSPPKPPKACAPQTRGSNIVREVSAETSQGGAHFTVDETTTVSEAHLGGNGASALHLAVKRNDATALQIDARMTPAGELEMHVLFGEGFHGIKEAVFTSADRETLRGQLDGKPLAPFSVRGKLDAVRFADGAPIPAGGVDGDLKKALAALQGSVQRDCSVTKPVASTLATPASNAAGSDGPAHRFDPNKSSGCQACEAAAYGTLSGCGIAAAASAVVCLWAYAICLAAALAVCFGTWYLTMCKSCSDSWTGCTGGPCCPTSCGGSKCCDNKETCVGTTGLCCSPGFQACGTSWCCATGENCVKGIPTAGNPSGYSCCPSGHQICSNTCCPNSNQICNPNTQTCCKRGAVCGNACCDGDDQVCVNSSSSTCCSNAHACGSVCCAKTASCADPSVGTCTACANCAGGECCFGQCCTGPQMYCDATTRSCRCKPSCDGKCAGPDGCGGTCPNNCGEFSVCYQNACCQPNCVGKCGGASDGCGGTCTACGPSQVCRGQSCCSDCTNATCGAGDGCGHTCTGSCPPNQFCNRNHQCQPEQKCSGSRVDCCGDGSCCLAAGQCYKCRCGP